MRHEMMMKQTDTIPLDKVQPGDSVRVVSIEAGASLKNRLAAMGLLADVKVRVVRNDGAGQIIVDVKNSKVILGRGMSHKVFVTEV